GDHEAKIAQAQYAPAVKTGDADVEGTRVAAHFQGFHHVQRIAAGGDGKDHVALLDHIQKLLGKNVFELKIVGPGGQKRNIIGERNGAEAGPARGDRSLAEIAGHVGSEGGASSISQKISRAPLQISIVERL